MIFFSYIFIFIAAALNALMDILENENFFNSKLKNFLPGLWYKRESWKTAKKIFGYKLDAWHIAKSMMIICFAFAIVFYKPFILILDFIAIGVVWNFTFNLFYNKIFK